MKSREIAKLKIATPEQMHDLGLRVSKLLEPGDLVVLTGPLGAGKTTFSRAVGEGLGAIGTVSSPTFVIARTHKLEISETVFVHVDAYRLGSPAEFDDLDIDYPNSIVLVEWGRGFTDGISDSWLELEIERSKQVESDDRTVTITGFGPRFESVQL